MTEAIWLADVQAIKSYNFKRSVHIHVHFGLQDSSLKAKTSNPNAAMRPVWVESYAGWNTLQVWGPGNRKSLYRSIETASPFKRDSYSFPCPRAQQQQDT